MFEKSWSTPALGAKVRGLYNIRVCLNTKTVAKKLSEVQLYTRILYIYPAFKACKDKQKQYPGEFCGETGIDF